LGAMALDLGAMTVFLYTFTEREKLYDLFELLTGARFTTSYTRVGGQIRDLPETFIPRLKKFLDEFDPSLNECDKLLTRNRIFVDRTRDIGVISKDRAIGYSLSGPNLRGCGIEHDLRRKHPYLDYEQYDFEVVVGRVQHRLKIRAPSFVNLSILPVLLPGCMVSDIVAVLGSLDFVMGECDR